MKILLQKENGWKCHRRKSDHFGQTETLQLSVCRIWKLGVYSRPDSSSLTSGRQIAEGLAVNGTIRFGNGTLVSGMGQRGENNLRGPQRSLLSPLPKDGWELDMFQWRKEAVEWEELKNQMRGKMIEPSLDGSKMSSRGGRTHFLAQEGKAWFKVLVWG